MSMKKVDLFFFQNWCFFVSFWFLCGGVDKEQKCKYENHKNLVFFFGLYITKKVWLAKSEKKT